MINLPKCFRRRLRRLQSPVHLKVRAAKLLGGGRQAKTEKLRRGEAPSAMNALQLRDGCSLARLACFVRPSLEALREQTVRER